MRRREAVTAEVAAQMGELAKGVDTGIVAEMMKGVDLRGLYGVAAQVADANKSMNAGLAAQMGELAKGVNTGIVAEMMKGVDLRGLYGVAAQVADANKSMNAGLASQLIGMSKVVSKFAMPRIIVKFDEVVDAIGPDVGVDWDRFVEGMSDLAVAEGLDSLGLPEDVCLSEQEAAEARAALAVAVVCLVSLLRAQQIEAALGIVKMLLDLLAYEVNQNLTIEGVFDLGAIFSIVSFVWSALKAKEESSE